MKAIRPPSLPTLFTALFVSIAMSFIFGGGQSSALSGSDFNAGNIIDDSVFKNTSSMDASQIQLFLESKVPVCDTNGTQIYSGSTTRAQYGAANGNPAPYTCLKDYQESVDGITNSTYCNGDIAAGVKSAAQIIYDVSIACNINPQSLIVLIQKEQSLITDDWPWQTQYRIATGYGCPDTAPCDEEFFGFFNQVYQAAQAFNRYAELPQFFNYTVNQNNFIYYHPSLSACGGSTVFLENQSTTGLYIYTPYQPNQAALDNLYGIGDGCSAYGNRNFWRIFNDWFGSTEETSFQLVISDDGSPTQYVVYNYLKQAIPTSAIKLAWGLDRVTLKTVSQGYLDTLADGPDLDVLMRVNSGNDVYLLDNGNRYRVTSQNQLDLWNLQNRTISNVTTGLGFVPNDEGTLVNEVTINESSIEYLVDGLNGGTLNFIPFSTTQVKDIWSGSDTIDISTGLMSLLSGAISSDQITSPKINYNSQEYLVVSNQRLSLPFNQANLYPGVSTAVSEATFNRLVPSAETTHLVRASSDVKVYAVFDGTKNHITNPEILQAWLRNSNDINIVNQDFIDFIPDGQTLNTVFVEDNLSNLYYLNGLKNIVPTELATAYSASAGGPLQQSNDYLLNMFATGSTTVSDFITSPSSSKIYLLTNSGTRHHITSVSKAQVWGLSDTTTLPDSLVASYTEGQILDTHVSNGSQDYVLIDGQLTSIDSPTQTAWGLSSPQVLSDGTLSRFTISTQPAQLSYYNNDSEEKYYLYDGLAYTTTDTNIANLWSINNTNTISNTAANIYFDKRILSRYVISGTSPTTRHFLVDTGVWYELNSSEIQRLINNNERATLIDSAAAPSIQSWSNAYVITTAGNIGYVVDKQTARPFPNTQVRDHWLNNSNSITVTDSFMNLLQISDPIERALRSVNDTRIYYFENSTKRWIQSLNAYINTYAPHTLVTDTFLSSTTDGSPIQ